MEIFKIDGIEYRIISTSTVRLSHANKNINGHFNIPSEVLYLGNIYEVVSIGNDAFYGCSRLTSVTIPNNINSIGEFAFYGCSSLTSISIPDSVTSIRDSAFNGCSSLTFISLPNNITYIGSYTFYRCHSLTSIIIPDSVTFIRCCAFWKCDSLTSITIPNIRSIEGNAFNGCSSLRTIYYSGDPELLKDLPDKVNIVNLNYKPSSWNELIS